MMSAIFCHILTVPWGKFVQLILILEILGRHNNDNKNQWFWKGFSNLKYIIVNTFFFVSLTIFNLLRCNGKGEHGKIWHQDPLPAHAFIYYACVYIFNFMDYRHDLVVAKKSFEFTI